MFSTWLRSVRNALRQRNTRARRRTRPLSLECLEDRLAPAVADHLIFLSQPGNTQVFFPIPNTVSVEVVDSQGALVPVESCPAGAVVVRENRA